jgi:hypothetical protein
MLEVTIPQWPKLPARDRFGLTVTGAGEHRFWLDDPHDIWWTTDVARG